MLLLSTQTPPPQLVVVVVVVTSPDLRSFFSSLLWVRTACLYCFFWPIFLFSVSWGMSMPTGVAVDESLTPVRRNLLCFIVCSLAAWIDPSQSLHRIALSSWQNRKALLSYIYIKPPNKHQQQHRTSDRNHPLKKKSDTWHTSHFGVWSGVIG